jgi:ABC-type multidrug transport system fused ATPase/permease subunit
VTVPNDRVTVRTRRGARLILDLVRHQPRTFAVAVTGAAVFAVCTAGSSLGVRWIIDHVIIPRFDGDGVAWTTVLAGCLVIVGISLVRATGVVVRRVYAGKTEWGVAEKLGMKVVGRLVEQPVAWHRRRPDGDLVARAGVDVEASVAVLAPLPYGSSVVLLLVVSAVGMIVLDPVVGAVALVALPALVFLNIGYQRLVDTYFNEAQGHMGRLSEAALESFEGVTVVKAFGAEDRETERLSRITAALRDARVKAMRVRATFEMLLDTFPSLANLAVLCLGAVRVRDGHMTVGDLAACMYLFTLLVIPMRLIGYVFSELPHSAAGYDRVTEIVNDPTEVDPAAAVGRAPEGTALRLTDATVRHIRELDVFRGVSLSVRDGETVALVGPTGCGKTTLLEAVAGLIPLAAGTVALHPDGAAFVFQEPFLFSESVLFNITLGRQVDAATLDEALTVADAGFLLSLERRLDTPLGERGVSLSGGQRQRLALVRALVRRPGLLLLDDTTSALDPPTELKVLSAIRASGLVRSVLMVASRPSAISTADSVAFMTGSGASRTGADRLVQGTHTELVRDVAEYRELVEAFENDRGAGAAP